MRRSPGSALGAAVALAACGAAPHPAPAQRVCPRGPVVLAGDDDVAALAGCTAVQALTIRTGAPLDLAPLARLARVDGDLRVGPSVGLDDVSLPALHTIAGALEIASNGNVQGVRLPALRHAGRIAIASNIELTTISLPALATVDGALAIAGNAGLGFVNLGGLRAVGGELAIVDHPRLALIEVGPGARAAAVRVANNPALDADVTAVLQALAGSH